MSLQRFLSFLMLAFAATAAVITVEPSEALAFDEFDTEHAPPRFTLDYKDLTLEIKGRARIGLHDLEGKGGPEYDSPTDTATIGTRSPFVELDSFDLALRMNWKELIWLNTDISFLTDSTSLSAIYFEYRQDFGDYSHGVEVGYLSPVVAVDRHTARYPLIATEYWKNPEYHVAYGGHFDFSADTSCSVYGALSFMRPLRQEPVHGSPTYAGSYSTLAYGSAKPYSGNSLAGTLLLRFRTHGVQADAFFHLGQIVTAKGLDTLYSSYPYYRSLDDLDADQNDALVWWAGGRLGYDGHGVHVLAEAIASQEQLLHRVGMYAQASYTWSRDSDFFQQIELLGRYEQIWTLDSTEVGRLGTALRTPATNNAISWDRKVITLAARARIFEDILSLRLEYSFFLEYNDNPNLGLANAPVDDNELLLQIEARY